MFKYENLQRIQKIASTPVEREQTTREACAAMIRNNPHVQQAIIEMGRDKLASTDLGLEIVYPQFFLFSLMKGDAPVEVSSAGHTDVEEAISMFIVTALQRENDINRSRRAIDSALRTALTYYLLTGKRQVFSQQFWNFFEENLVWLTRNRNLYSVMFLSALEKLLRPDFSRDSSTQWANMVNTSPTNHSNDSFAEHAFSVRVLCPELWSQIESEVRVRTTVILNNLDEGNERTLPLYRALAFLYLALHDISIDTTGVHLSLPKNSASDVQQPTPIPRSI